MFRRRSSTLIMEKTASIRSLAQLAHNDPDADAIARTLLEMQQSSSTEVRHFSLAAAAAAAADDDDDADDDDFLWRWWRWCRTSGH